MAARLLGAALLVLTGLISGWRVCEAGRVRARHLAELNAALGTMADELRMLSRPMGEIFSGLSCRGAPELRDFFARLAAETGQRPLSELWQEGLNSLPLEDGARQSLSELGAVLGRYDAQSQAAAIALARSRLEELLREQRRENTRRTRLLPGLGACLGAMAAVILM